MHKITTQFLAVCIAYCLAACNQTNSAVIPWKIFEPKGSKTIAVDSPLMGETEMEWPVFSDEALKHNHQVVSMEGYYLPIETLDIFDMEDLKPGKTKIVKMLTVSRQFTTKVCGVPQFRQHEFCVLEGFGDFTPGAKLTLEGRLEIDTDGKEENMIKLIKIE